MRTVLPGQNSRPRPAHSSEATVSVGKTPPTHWYSRAYLAEVFAKRPAQLIALVGFIAVATILIYVFAAGSESTTFASSDFTAATKSNTVVNGSGGLQLATASSSSSTYTWDQAGYDGGGRGNDVAIDPDNPGHAALGGDVWGPHTTANQGNLWIPTMWGLNGIGDDYTRAVAYSVKYPGVSYWGDGTLGGLGGSYTGFFGTNTAGSYQLVKTNTTLGFATSQASASQFTPRAVGKLIAVDYDSSTGVEYIYALTNKGLVRSTNGGATFTVLGLTSVPDMAWKAVVVAPDGSLYVASYGTRTSNTAVTGQQEWHVTNPRTTPTFTEITGAFPAPVNDFAVINGTVWEASTGALYKLVGSAWQQVGGSFFTVSGMTISSIDGNGQTIYVGMGTAPTGDYIAKSSDGGTTWKFVTAASAIATTVQGTTRTWWLNGHGLPSSYGVEQLAVDPHNANFVVSSGFRGAYVTTDGGVTWYPADNGLDGSEVSHVLAGANGQAWNDDTDWAQPSGSPWHTIATTDHYSSVQGSSTSVTWPTPALTRTVGGHTYALVKGKPYDITEDGKSIADDYFRGAMVNPTDLEVSSDGYIYIGQYGGGVLVGTPPH